LNKFKLELEEIRGRVFVSGKGWPTYLPMDGDNPLGADDLRDWMVAYKPIDLDRK
jgi:hypothetical protein